jgi:hypothetical protein
MQFSHKIKSFAVGAVGFACFAGSVFYPPVAQAFPFQKNAQSFTSYLNSQAKWRDGMKRVFSNVYDCKFREVGDSSSNPGEQYAMCTGYMTVYSPQGVKVCLVNDLRFEQKMVPEVERRYIRTYGLRDCVWK